MNKLEEAADKYSNASGYNAQYHIDKLSDAFKAGAEWAMDRLRNLSFDNAMDEITGFRRWKNEEGEE